MNKLKKSICLKKFILNKNLDTNVSLRVCTSTRLAEFVSKFETSRNVSLTCWDSRSALKFSGENAASNCLPKKVCLKLSYIASAFLSIVFDLEREIFTPRLNGFAQVGKVILL